jgi:hypothetical protein
MALTHILSFRLEPYLVLHNNGKHLNTILLYTSSEVLCTGVFYYSPVLSLVAATISDEYLPSES